MVFCGRPCSVLPVITCDCGWTEGAGLPLLSPKQGSKIVRGRSYWPYATPPTQSLLPNWGKFGGVIIQDARRDDLGGWVVWEPEEAIKCIIKIMCVLGFSDTQHSHTHNYAIPYNSLLPCSYFNFLFLMFICMH